MFCLLQLILTTSRSLTVTSAVIMTLTTTTTMIMTMAATKTIIMTMVSTTTMTKNMSMTKKYNYKYSNNFKTSSKRQFLLEMIKMVKKIQFALLP